MTDHAVAAELDAAHRNAQESFRARDLDAYMGLFSPSLRYQQLDGRVIGREQLASDVQAQFAAVEASDTSYTRESLEVIGDRAIEILNQVASATTRHFVFLRRVWRITRRGRYVWERSANGWVIREVEILNERVG